MSPKKLLALTAVVAALFAFIVLFERKMPTTEERTRKGDLYWDIPEEQDRADRARARRRDPRVPARRRGRLEDGPAGEVPGRPVRGRQRRDRSSPSCKRAGGDGRGRGPAGRLRPGQAGREGHDRLGRCRRSEVPEDPHDRVRHRRSPAPTSSRRASRERRRSSSCPASVLASLKKNADDFESREVFGGPPADMHAHRDPARAGPARLRAQGGRLVARGADRGPRRCGRRSTASSANSAAPAGQGVRPRRPGPARRSA